MLPVATRGQFVAAGDQAGLNDLARDERLDIRPELRPVFRSRAGRVVGVGGSDRSPLTSANGRMTEPRGNRGSIAVDR